MKKINKILVLVILSLALALLGCEDRSDLTAPEAPSTGNANFTTFVSIGNSLTAGYQNGALYESSQLNSFGNLIAKQVGASYEQPLMSEPGVSHDGRMEVKSIVPFELTMNTKLGSPEKLTYPKAYNNLGIPGALLPDILQATDAASSISGNNVFFDLILRGKGTALQQALSLKPTFVTLWIGNNDILGYATSGGVLPHTPTAIFNALYTQLAGAIAQTGAKVLVANIPNVSAVPFFTTVGPGVGLALQDIAKLNPAVKGLVYQLSVAPFIGLATPTDLFTHKVLITLTASDATNYIGDTTGKYYTDNGITPPATVNTQFPFGLTPENPFPTQFVLDPAELAEVKSVTASFNNTIKTIADTTKGFALVDINAFFDGVAASGYTSVDGNKYTTEYVNGGTFGLDGIHPTSQGYAIIANQFIKIINSNFLADIPLIHVATIPGTITLAGKKTTVNKYGIPQVDAHVFDNVLY